MVSKTIFIILVCIASHQSYSMEQAPNNQSKSLLMQRYVASKAAANKMVSAKQPSNQIVIKPTYTGPDTLQSSLSAIYVNNDRHVVNAAVPGFGNVNEVTNQMWHASGFLS